MSGPITPHKDPRSDWRPDSNPIYDKTNDAIESSTKPVVEAVHKQTEQGGWQGKIDRLDSKGDTARSRTMLDGELDIGVLNPAARQPRPLSRRPRCWTSTWIWRSKANRRT